MASYKLRVRMYRQGLGDCFLLSFANGRKRPAHVVIDCGTLGAKKPSVDMGRVIADLAREVTPGSLQAIVATHEHMDHLSGFGSALDDFKRMKAKEVWVAWTEDADDPRARELEKYQGDLVGAAERAARYMKEALGATQRTAAGRLGEAVHALLAADGLKEKLNETMAAVMSLGKPRFLQPGTVLQPEWAPGVRVYVLGPPRDDDHLRTLGRHGSEELYGLAGATSRELVHRIDQLTGEAAPGGDSEQKLPFDARLCLDASDPEIRARFARAYDDPGEAWRRIDHDWLAVTADLALQLDNYTNNTSLVLAIEVGDKVLLFPGDAQLGNWESWKDLKFEVKDGRASRTVTTADLLRRTVFYKVGHHSSFNATPRGQGRDGQEPGLELMEHPDLVAFIPLNEEVAKAKRWDMPAGNLYKRLLEKANGRVYRADIVHEDVGNDAWRKARKAARVAEADAFIDYFVA